VRLESRPGAAPSAFSRLAVAHAFALAGDAMVTVALAGSLFFSISPTAARGRVALSLVLTMAPFAIVAPFLGPVIDRAKGGRRAIVLAAAVARAIACIWMATVVDSLLLFPAAFAVLVLSKTHAVAKSSLVAPTVGAEELLVEANAKLALTGVIAGVVASGPAVAVLQLSGAAWVLRLAAAVYVAAAIAALRLAPVDSPEPGRHEPGGTAELNDPGIRLAATATATLRAAVGFLTFLIAFEFRRRGAPSWWFGIVLGASMVGSFLGAVVAPRLRERTSEERMVAGALISIAIGAIAAGRVGGRPAAAILAFIVGIAANAGKLGFDSLVQRDAPDAAQGRAFARFESEFQLVWVAGALLPVIISIPQRVGFFVMAVGLGVAALTYLTGRRAIARAASGREVDAGEPEAGGVDLGRRG
jgi:hypothetical protein